MCTCVQQREGERDGEKEGGTEGGAEKPCWVFDPGCLFAMKCRPPAPAQPATLPNHRQKHRISPTNCTETPLSCCLISQTPRSQVQDPAFGDQQYLAYDLHQTIAQYRTYPSARLGRYSRTPGDSGARTRAISARPGPTTHPLLPQNRDRISRAQQDSGYTVALCDIALCNAGGKDRGTMQCGVLGSGHTSSSLSWSICSSLFRASSTWHKYTQPQYHSPHTGTNTHGRSTVHRTTTLPSYRTSHSTPQHCHTLSRYTYS